MTPDSRSHDELLQENARLREELAEAEGTIRAISRGEVDAFLVRAGAEEQVLVLDGVDRPYRLLIERMNQGALTLAADGTVIYANRRFAELIDRPAADQIGTSLEECVAEHDRPRLRELLAKARSADCEMELELRCSGGNAIPVHVGASPLLEKEGIVCLIVTDLTQQRRHEAERVLRVAAESAAAALRDADRRKDEFLAMLAHELRGPLAPLRNGVEILSAISPRTPEAQRTCEMMSRQIQALVRLVDDLLDVGRVTQGKIKLELEVVDLRTVVARALESCRPLLDQHGHALETRLPELPIPVAVDVVRASQAMANLLTNAAKFTPRGGHIWLVVEQGRDGAGVVRVRDDGVGIDPAVLPRIFDLFVQVDPSESRSEGGLGIGLTLARRLIEMHGGSLKGASDGRGRGSEFELRLPAARPAGGDEPFDLEAVKPKPAIAAGTRTRRVLIVDDNQDSAESLALLMRLRGHDVRHAHDGLRAIEVAVEFRPDVVLLDIGLPGINGYDVARRMSGRAELAGVRIVAVSGYGSPEHRTRAAEAGFHDHLVKPIDLRLLEQLLDASDPDGKQERGRAASRGG